MSSNNPRDGCVMYADELALTYRTGTLTDRIQYR